MNDIRLTRRGWAVAVLALIIFGVIFTKVTADFCWTGTGYGSCTQMYQSTTNHYIKEINGNE